MAIVFLLPCCLAQVMGGGAGGTIEGIWGSLRGSPAGWTADYERRLGDDRRVSVALDGTVRHGGDLSARLQIGPPVSNPPKHLEQKLRLGQLVKADLYKGRQVRLSAWLRASGEASLSIVAEGPYMLRASRDLSLRGREVGSTSWAFYDVSIDVPSDAIGIAISFVLLQEGQLWIDDVRLESAGACFGERGVSVPMESVPGIWRRFMGASPELANSDFEQR